MNQNMIRKVNDILAAIRLRTADLNEAMACDAPRATRTHLMEVVRTALRLQDATNDVCQVEPAVELTGVYIQASTFGGPVRVVYKRVAIPGQWVVVKIFDPDDAGKRLTTLETHANVPGYPQPLSTIKLWSGVLDDMTRHWKTNLKAADPKMINVCDLLAREVLRRGGLIG